MLQGVSLFFLLISLSLLSALLARAQLIKALIMPPPTKLTIKLTVLKYDIFVSFIFIILHV